MFLVIASLILVVFVVVYLLFLRKGMKTIEGMTEYERVLPMSRESGYAYDHRRSSRHESNNNDAMSLITLGMLSSLKKNPLDPVPVVSLSSQNYCPECCNDEYDPVCGSNGITYRTACFAKCNGLKPPYKKGTCASLKKCSAKDSKDSNQKPSTQPTTPDIVPVSNYCMCAQTYDPVVDATGAIFQNMCFAKCSPSAVPPFAKSKTNVARQVTQPTPKKISKLDSNKCITKGDSIVGTDGSSVSFIGNKLCLQEDGSTIEYSSDNKELRKFTPTVKGTPPYSLQLGTGNSLRFIDSNNKEIVRLV